MRKRGRILCAIAVGVCLALWCAACGGPKTEGSDPPGETPPGESLPGSSGETPAPPEGEKEAHCFNANNVCEDCGAAWEYTAGLLFEEREDGTYAAAGFAAGTAAEGALVLPYGYNGRSVTAVKDEAFALLPALTEVILPDSVTSIGCMAFSGCISLQRAEIPNGVAFLGDSAFAGCISLGGISLPGGLRALGNGVFAGCASLTDVALPGEAEKIGNAAFSGCVSLARVTIGSKVASVGGEAFSGCKKLREICYLGTVAQWKQIGGDPSSDYRTGEYRVVCADGALGKHGDLLPSEQ